MGQMKRTARTLVQTESLSVEQVRMYSECIGRYTFLRRRSDLYDKHCAKS